MRSLDDLVESLPAFAPKTGKVDVSDLFPGDDGQPLPPETEVFTFVDPTVEHFFAATQDADKLRKTYPHWTKEQATNVALLALCHQSPVSDKPRGVLYAQMCAKSPTLFMRLNDGFNEAFPHLKDIRKAAEDPNCMRAV